MKERDVEVIRDSMLKRMRALSRVGFKPFPRRYVRVLDGGKELLHIHFNADTLQETRAADRVRAKLVTYPNARVVVSERCEGALAGFPAVGESVDGTRDDDVVSVSEAGIKTLRALRNGEAAFQTRRLKAVNRLVSQGFAQREHGLFSITAAGLAVLEKIEKEER